MKRFTILLIATILLAVPGLMHAKSGTQNSNAQSLSERIAQAQSQSLPEQSQLSADDHQLLDPFAAQRPVLMQEFEAGRLSKAIFKAAAVFEKTYPRTVKNFEGYGIHSSDFKTLWEGFKKRDKDILSLLNDYEAGRIKTRTLVKKINQGSIRIQSVNCESMTDTYVAGCRRGGGDLFTCFVLGEQYLCVCENLDNPNPRNCGIIDILQ